MSDNWQVGDLAIAVGVKRVDFPTGWFPQNCARPSLGTILRVDGVTFVNGLVGLVFNEFPSPHYGSSWHSASFRKIRPDEREACEPEFVTLLKRSKVTVQHKEVVHLTRQSGNLKGGEK